MKTALVALVSALLSHSEFAADTTCLTTATEKKLTGAARNSFMKKCQSGN